MGGARPDRVCLTFHAGDAVAERLTYGELARRSSAHARLFRRAVCVRAMPWFSSRARQAGFVAAFLGAQEAGLLAVPCPPPEPLESARRVRERVREIFARCRARALLDPMATPVDAEFASALGEARVALLAPPGPGAAARPEGGAPDADGFPLGVLPVHLGQRRAGQGCATHPRERGGEHPGHGAQAYALSPDEVPVTWLPLFHDMGLVAYVLMPLVLGHTAHVMPPLAFIARPASWLALISRVGGTMASAPNFAYALCARKVSDAELAELDLSSWRLACNGSEPVTKAAVEAFIRRFAPGGFRPSALLPCYGLAEDTLCATSRRPGEGARFEEISRAGLEQEGAARLEPGGITVGLGRPAAAGSRGRRGRRGRAGGCRSPDRRGPHPRGIADAWLPARHRR